MARRILVTGGAGFLGRHVAAAFAKQGSRITVLDDLSASSSTFQCPELRNASIRTVLGSINDRKLTQALVREHDAVAHLASVVGVEETMRHPIATMRNLQGTLNVVEALESDQVILFGSSADVYGMHSHIHQRPMRETDWALYEGPLVSRWVYPKVKALEEHAVAASRARSVTVRIFNAYGPGMDYPGPRRLVPQLLYAALSGNPLRISGSGEQRRSLCFYEDTVRGLLLAFEHVASGARRNSSTFNIGNPESESVASTANRIARLALELGVVDTLPPILLHEPIYSRSFDDSWDRAPDISLAKAVLGFNPRVSLDEGLRRTLHHYAAHGANRRANLAREIAAQPESGSKA